MTSLLGRIFDFDLDAVTADVDNESVRTEDLSTESKFNEKLTPKTAQELSDAIDTANNNGGGYLIELPQAEKNTANEIDISGLSLPLTISVDDVWLRGQGKETTVVDAKANPALKIDAGNANDIYLSDFRIEGSSGPVVEAIDWHGTMTRVGVQSTSGGSSIAANFKGCNASVIFDCTFVGGSEGVRSEESANNAPNWQVFRECSMTSNGIGMVWRWTGNGSQPWTMISMNNLIEKNDNVGMGIKGIANPVISGGRFSRNDQDDGGSTADLRIQDSSQGNSIAGFVGGGIEFDGNSGTASNTDWGIEIENTDSKNGQGTFIGRAHFRDYATSPWFIRASADDVDFWHPVWEGTSLGNNFGARQRWRGIIGGGPFGGVDLSSTTGQHTGDLAIADGTSAASAGDRARWNGTGWDYTSTDGTV